MKSWFCNARPVRADGLSDVGAARQAAEVHVPTPPGPPFTMGGKNRFPVEKWLRERRRCVSAALFTLAIISRVAAVWLLQEPPSFLAARYEHGEIAANLLAGRGFAIKFLGAEGPTSQQAPVYPVIVAIAYAIGGVAAPKSLLILELAQSILGGLLVLGVLRVCHTIAPASPLMAWIAGLIVSIHPTLIYAATHVQVAILGATLLTWVLAWAYQTGSSGEARDAAITGGLLAVLALTDPILAVSIVGAAWAICGKDVRRCQVKRGNRSA